jgi:hypothetical protein
MHRESDGVLRLDKPHVQALPGQFDAKLRALAPGERDAFVAKHYA